jgi:chaperone required for assembly of F1-ATPase
VPEPRSYAKVAVARGSAAVRAGGDAPLDAAALPPFLVLLDGLALRTPADNAVALPTVALADAIAGEWAAEAQRIDPRSVPPQRGPLTRPLARPLTRLANTAIDGVQGREEAVRSAIVAYGTSDLLCYRADAPEALARRQSASWDGVLAWAGEALGVRLRVGAGLMPIAQPRDAVEAIAAQLASRDCFALTALHCITSLTGSAVLALAVAHGHVTAEAAWTAAHVDEAYQSGQWGEDAEAARRLARRRGEMLAASRFLALLAPLAPVR